MLFMSSSVLRMSSKSLLLVLSWSLLVNWGQESFAFTDWIDFQDENSTGLGASFIIIFFIPAFLYSLLFVPSNVEMQSLFEVLVNAQKQWLALVNLADQKATCYSLCLSRSRSWNCVRRSWAWYTLCLPFVAFYSTSLNYLWTDAFTVTAFESKGRFIFTLFILKLPIFSICFFWSW